jgi:hypothetical protein
MRTVNSSSFLQARSAAGVVCAGLLLWAALAGASRTSTVLARAQDPIDKTVAPVYEGFQRNPDGSFDLLFGYFNRNWDDEIDVPVGPDNRLEPGGPDQGQPAHFLPRRNRFVFRVRVPANFGNNEIVWTLKTKGQTLYAYGTLKPLYEVDDISIGANFGGGGGTGFHPDLVGNKAPALEVPGEKGRLARVGEPVTLRAVATDDGLPRPRSLRRSIGRDRVTPDSATGLRLSWFVYRGTGDAVFDPPQTKVWEDLRDGGSSPWSVGWQTPPVPPDNTWVTRVTFNKPGRYVLRCLAHDGAADTHADVTFVVN